MSFILNELNNIYHIRYDINHYSFILYYYLLIKINIAKSNKFENILYKLTYTFKTSFTKKREEVINAVKCLPVI